MVQVKDARLIKSNKPICSLLSPEALIKQEKVKKYLYLRNKGFREKEALMFLDIKRSTLFLWIKKYKEKATELNNKSRRPLNFRKSKVISHKLISHILKIRQENIMYGKEKIKRELDKLSTGLNDKELIVSVSTVGRVLKYLLNKNKILNIKRLIGKNAGYRKEQKKRRYAERIQKQKANNPGELIQIDHMALSIQNKLRIKEFRAIDPITRLSISRIYNSANAINAREFLKEVIKEFDFEIKSIQVDGGSEFMAEFEDYCREQNIKLYVLPPRSPKMNCYVERANETYRYEFWNIYEIPDTMEETRKLLRKFEYYYNTERMHQSLNYLTPMEYWEKIKNEVA